MKLLPLDNAALIEQAAGWLTRKENYQWLDFGSGQKPITPALLRIMAQRETNFLRAYTASRDDGPIGLVALSHVDRAFSRTGSFWGLSGDKSFRSRGYSTVASSRFLALAFRELELRTIHTWTVDGNPSVRIIERLGFRFIGRQRRCHFIDGQPRDRLLFDLLPGELCDLGVEWLPGEKTLREAV